MPRPRRPIKVKADKAKAVKPKPVVSGSTGVVTEILKGLVSEDDDAEIEVNGWSMIVPVRFLPLGFKVGDSIICRFQLVGSQADLLR